MRVFAPFLLLVAVGGACGSGVTTISVAELLRDHVHLAGKRIQVRGWLPEACSIYSCLLFPNREASKGYVSIGSSTPFDSAVQHAARRDIVIEATVTARCWDGCFDRGDQLANPKLIRVLP